MVVLANIYSDRLKSYYVLLLTRKRGNCECIATWGCPTPRLSFFALITTPCQVWSRWTYPLPYYSVLLLIYCFTLWPWPLTLNICSVSPASWWNSELNLNAIEQSAAELLCNFNILPNDLEHVLTCCARIVSRSLTLNNLLNKYS